METTNQDAEKEIISAVGADTLPTLYSGNNTAGTLSAQMAAALASFGEALTDEAADRATGLMLKHEFHAAAAKVWLGILCLAKKKALDARGNFADETQRGEGFENWHRRVLGKYVSERNIQRYMALARAFLADAEAALGVVPVDDEEQMKNVLLHWCGERTLTQIDADIRAEAKRRELTASEDEAPKEEPKPEPTPAERMAALLERFDRVLDRAQEYDTQVRLIFEESGADWSNEAAKKRLEALAKHHAELHEFYAGLFAKAKEYGQRAAANS